MSDADYVIKLDLEAINRVDKGGKVKKELEKTGKEAADALDKGMNDGLKKSKKGVKELEKQVASSGKGMVGKFTEWGVAIKIHLVQVVAGAVARVGSFLIGLGKKAIGVADQYQQAQIAFTTMLGSAEASKDMLKDLSDFAAKTPFDIQGVRQNAKQLLAMGVSANRLLPTLKALGDVSSGTGADLSRLALNYGQVITQGKLTGRELRDFLVNGVPLIDELAKNLGVAKDAIQDMVTNGEVSADDVARAFETMSSEGGKFANLMHKQSSTLSGAWSNLGDVISQIGEKIGSRFLPQITAAVAWLENFVSKFATSEPDYFANQIARVNEEIEKLKSDKMSIEEKIQKLNDLFKNGAIGSEEYSKKLNQLLHDEDSLISKQEKLNDTLEEYNKKRSVALKIEKIYEEKVNKLQKQLDDRDISLKEHSKLMQEALDLRDIEIIRLEEAGKTALFTLDSYGKLGSLFGKLQTVNYQTAEAMLNLKRATSQADHAFSQVSTATSQEQFLALKAAALEAMRALAAIQQSFIDNARATPIMENPKLHKRAFKESINMMKMQGQIARLEKSSFSEFVSGVKDANTQLEKLDVKKRKGGGGSRKAKDETKEMIKELGKQRDLQIEAVQKSVLTEEKKMESLMDIKERYEKDLKALQGKTNDELLREAEKYVKDKEKQYAKDTETHAKAMQKQADTINKHLEKIEEIKDKYEEVRQEAVKSIRAIDHELGQLDADHADTLSSRFVDIQKTIKDMERENSSLKYLARTVFDDTLRSMYDAGASEFGGVDIQKLMEYKKLHKEMAFVMEKTTEDQRKQAEAIDKLSDAEKRHNDYLEKRLVLEEKRAINDAFRRQGHIGAQKIFYDEQKDVYTYENERGQIEEITDFQNQQLAQQLMDKQAKLQTELELEQGHAQKVYNEYKITQDKLKNLYKQDTTQFLLELRNKQQAYRAYVASIRAMESTMNSIRSVAERRAYGGQLSKGKVTMVGENGLEKIVARQSSYVQPTNSISSTTNHNNTNALTINGIEIGNFGSIDDMLDMLRTRLSRHR